MTTIDITKELEKAEAAEATAKAKAEALREQQATAEAERKAAQQKARNEFNDHRAATFHQTFHQAVEDAREAFHTAVANGENPTGAWLNYVTAQKKAYAELDRIERRQAEIDHRTHLAWEAKVNTWNDRLIHATGHGSGNINHEELAEINQEIRDALTQAGKSIAEQFTPTNTREVPLAKISTYRPLGVSHESKLKRLYGDTDYPTAFARAVELATATATSEWQAAYEAALNAAGGA